MTSNIDRAQLSARDGRDPLAFVRARFALPENTIYLDGNSLGALPRVTAERLERVIRAEWGGDLIRSWNKHSWIHLPLQIGRKLARLIGADPNEVAVADSTSINLFKLVAAALRMRPERRVIVSERGNFPSDLYMIQGLVDLLGQGHEFRVVERDQIEAALDDEVALLSLSHVNYRTSAMHDMARLTRAVQERGGLMLWDLAHSAGSMPVDLDGWGVDLAVGCGYKFLNGGPGAPAFLFIAERLQEHAHQPLTGWLGHAQPFEFASEYRPAPGIARNLCGTPPILSMSALDAGLDVFDGVDMADVRRKSVELGDLFLALMEQECGPFGFQVACPQDARSRGSQVGFSHAEGYAIVQALIARGVVGDFRTPNVLRFGMTPLYLRFVDIWDAVAALRQVMEQEDWRRPEFRQREMVT